jgi:hypothetical protein
MPVRCWSEGTGVSFLVLQVPQHTSKSNAQLRGTRSIRGCDLPQRSQEGAGALSAYHPLEHAIIQTCQIITQAALRL